MALLNHHIISSENEKLKKGRSGIKKTNGKLVGRAVGGMLASGVNVSGASEVFSEGFITYSNQAKGNI